MALKLAVTIRDVRFVGANFQVEIEVEALNGARQVTTLSTPHATASASNFQAGIKNLIIAYALNQYGVTLVADEILLR